MSNAPNAVEKEELWKALVDTAHALLMYKSHKRYVQDVMLKEMPDISADELAVRLNIPKGESLVLQPRPGESQGKPKALRRQMARAKAEVCSISRSNLNRATHGFEIWPGLPLSID